MSKLIERLRAELANAKAALAAKPEASRNSGSYPPACFIAIPWPIQTTGVNHGRAIRVPTNDSLRGRLLREMRKPLGLPMGGKTLSGVCFAWGEKGKPDPTIRTRLDAVSNLATKHGFGLRYLPETDSVVCFGYAEWDAVDDIARELYHAEAETKNGS